MLYKLGALEQFDIIYVGMPFGLGGNNIIWNFFFFFFFTCASIYRVFGTFFFSFERFCRLYFFSFLVKLLSENVNVQRLFFYKLISFVFLFVLLNNLTGLIPYTMTVTSFLVVTFFFGLACFIGANILGVLLHSFKIFSLFLPSGTPFILIPFIIIIEVISYLARVVSLSIRLFANMMAGHSLLKILSGFLWDVFGKFALWFIPAIVAFTIVLIIYVLELLIALLQSAVYLILVSIYVNDVINLH